jgi:hypothetical protein
LAQKYTLTNGGSVPAPLYIQLQVYDPITGNGISGVTVSVYIKVNGINVLTLPMTTGANGLAKSCGSLIYLVSDQIQIGYGPVTAPGYATAPGDSSVPVTTSPGKPSLC